VEGRRRSDLAHPSILALIQQLAKFFVPDPAEARSRDFPLLSIILLVLLASATSLGNGFAYDDRWIIVNNPNVTETPEWWKVLNDSYWPSIRNAALYRPLAILGYNWMWTVGGGEPLIFHAVNVILYATVSVLVYRMAMELLPPFAAWVAAALFAVHPVHVEAVGNIVGQAELWSGVAVVGSVAIFLRARRDGGILDRKSGVFICGLYFFGMMFKETAIVLPALIVAAEWLVVRDPRPMRDRVGPTLRLLLWLTLIAFVFLGLRVWVTGELGGDVEHPGLRNLGVVKRAWVMLALAPEFARLLIWPARLYADYSPRHISVLPEPHPDHASGALLVLCLLVLTIVSARRFPLVSFGLAWVVITISPVANIVLPTGILIAERTLFLPSIGVVLCAAALVPWCVRESRKRIRAVSIATAGALAVLLVVGAAHSAERQRTWKDSDTVFMTLVSEAPMSFKGHYAYGGMLWEQKRRAEGEREWRYAIALYPSYFGVYQELAHRYREAHVCPAAIPLYQKALSVEPALPFSRVGLTACYLEMANFRAARSQARIAIGDSLYRPAFEFMLCKADSALVARDSIDFTNRWVPLSVQRKWRAGGPLLEPIKTPKAGGKGQSQNARTPALLYIDSLGPVTSKLCKSLLHTR
jgi:hypothetical protein